jgi:hypothetical protein
MQNTSRRYAEASCTGSNLTNRNNLPQGLIPQKNNTTPNIFKTMIYKSTLNFKNSNDPKRCCIILSCKGTLNFFS